jgi:DNA-binding Lrp family transcriptional regulator
MISVDTFDLKILSALQDDGRLTNQQLADIAGLSRRSARGGACGWKKRR